MLEDVKVRVVGDDVLSISSHGTIHELVVVGVGINQPKVDIGFLKLCGVQPGYCLDYVVGNLWGGLLSEDFLILLTYSSYWALRGSSLDVSSRIECN